MLKRLGATIVALPSGRVVSRLNHRTAIASLRFDGDATRAVTAADNSPVARVWDVASGRLERELSGHFGDVVTAAIDPAGAVIVTGSNDGQGRTWDAQTGRVQTVLPGHLNFVDNVDVTADGAFVVTGSPDRTARTWTTGGRLEAVLAGHTDAVTTSLFTPRGAMVVTASDDGTIRLWDSGTSPNLVKARVRPPSTPALEAITEAGRSTARADGSDIELNRDGTTTTLAGHTDVVTSVAFSRDGDRLVSASRDNDAIL